MNAVHILKIHFAIIYVRLHFMPSLSSFSTHLLAPSHNYKYGRELKPFTTMSRAKPPTWSILLFAAFTMTSTRNWVMSPWIAETDSPFLSCTLARVVMPAEIWTAFALPWEPDCTTSTLRKYLKRFNAICKCISSTFSDNHRTWLQTIKRTNNNKKHHNMYKKHKNTQKVTKISDKVWDSMDIIFISRQKCVTY